MPLLCLFDLDGTLVDSERLCSRALAELLPMLDDPVDVLTARYRGLKLAAILTDLEARLGAPLPADFETRYRARLGALFARELRPMPGAAEMLARLPFQRCVASSGPTAKIAQALELCGLATFLPHRFSAYEVGAWKPDPGLFLHAARVMGYPPERCVVIEDSEVGLQAAQAAGMRAVHFAPDPGVTKPGPHPVLHDLRELNGWLQSCGLAAKPPRQHPSRPSAATEFQR